MRKALATLLVGDVQLTNNNKPGHAKGKISFSKGNGSAGINKQMTMEDEMKIAEQGIAATHYYVKFIPKNEADYNKLKMDSLLTTYPFPLDNEQTQYSGSYRDPGVSAGLPTYQYAAVPVGYKLPNVPYQKLEDLFIPDERDRNNTVNVMGAQGFSYSVSAQELAIYSECLPHIEYQMIDGIEVAVEVNSCDNYSNPPPPIDPHRYGKDWRPHGRITLYDDTKQQTIGVEGIKVRARRWFTTYTGITDVNGYYAVDGWYTRPANYWLDFERYDFSVNDHRGGPREISGPKQEAAWNLELTGYDKFCGEIFRAAHHYYYRDIQGLRRPPMNSFWATQVKIAAFDWYENADNGDMWAGRNLLLGSLIHIYHPQQSSQDTYATTIHELAHAVHWDMSSPVIPPFLTTYGQSDTRVAETWATGVQWYLTKMEYPNYKGRINYPGNYTNPIIDLVDGPGLENFGHGTFFPTDQVVGYSMIQIQESLRNQKTFIAWKNNLINNYENDTEQYVSTLFDYWGNY